MACLHTQYKKGKGKDTCKYLRQIGFFFGHRPFSLWSEMPLYEWGQQEG